MRVSLLTLQQRCPLSARPYRQVVALSPPHTITPDAFKRSLVASATSLASCSSFCGTKLGLLHMRPRIATCRIGQACRTAKQRTTASFFGVGAPEALVIAVVALLVFGPKGLAEAAAGLGKTLRAFQPTIRELADVSNELKSTLEKEIGLNEVKAELQRPPTATTLTSATEDAASPSTATPSSLADPRMVQATDAIAEAVDPEIKRKRADSQAAAWGGAPPAATPPMIDPPAVVPPGGGAEAPSAGTPAGSSLAGMSMEELERELARRKAATPPGDA